MKLILLFISSFVLGCNSISDQCTKSNVSGFSHFNTDSLTIYKTTGGDVLKKIGPDEEAGYTVQITQVKDTYFRITINALDLEDVWVEKGALALNTRNYNLEKIPLYKNPDKSSAVNDFLVHEQTVMVTNVCEEWAYIEGKDGGNKVIKGWLQPDMQCGNPYTTCP